jgi:hypothetical protein
MKERGIWERNGGVESKIRESIHEKGYTKNEEVSEI